MNVAVLGASDNPEKYAHQAIVRLKSKGHHVFPVNPTLKEVEGLPVFASLKDIPDSIDTISMYVSKEKSDRLADEIMTKSPRRIIFNPGAENPALEARAKAAGIRTLEACTLVMLSTDQFDG